MPYRTAESRALVATARSAPKTWLLRQFKTLDEYAECARCGASTGSGARLCYGESFYLGLWWLCPRVPHFHLVCRTNEKHRHPCGHRWLMATADQPEEREVTGGTPLNRWF